MGSEVLRVVEIQGKGRALVASQALKGGQIVLRESPILLYSASSLSAASSSSSYCDHCFRSLQSQSLSSSCPSCSVHRFCSPNCVSHSRWVCESLGRLCSRLSSEPMERHLQARFLLAAYNLALLSPSHFQTLLSLRGAAADDSTAAAAAEFLHPLISSAFPSQQSWFSMELSAALLAKDKLNAFGLMEPFSENAPRSVRAYGIYPKASSFNHDCLPNACRFDYLDTNSGPNNTDIIVRMIHDVPEGREVCLSYFPVNENYSSRQRRLREDYGFACNCDRCKVEANWSDNDDDELMDEEEPFAPPDQTMEADNDCGGEAEEFDFPHAYFFLKFMCNRNNCWGTLAPLHSSNLMECNVCGNLKNEEDD